MIKMILSNLIKLIVFGAIGALLMFKVMDNGIKDCCPVCHERIKMEFNKNKK